MHHLCVGVSSGANLVAATRLAARYRTVVTVFPYSYAKYQTIGLKHCQPGQCPHEHRSVIQELLAPGA